MRSREGVAEYDVTITGGFDQVLLPNGFTYNDGETARLSEYEVSKLSDAAFDLGMVSIAPVTPTVIGGRDYVVTGPVTLTAVNVTPVDPSVADPGTQQFTAEAEFDDGTTVDVTNSEDLTWSSGDEAVATIDDAGLATTVAAGSSVITASLQRAHDDAATEGTSTLTVT